MLMINLTFQTSDREGVRVGPEGRNNEMQMQVLATIHSVIDAQLIASESKKPSETNVCTAKAVKNLVFVGGEQ